MGTVGVTIKSSIVCVAESTLCGTVIKAFNVIHGYEHGIICVQYFYLSIVSD